MNTTPSQRDSVSFSRRRLWQALAQVAAISAAGSAEAADSDAGEGSFSPDLAAQGDAADADTRILNGQTARFVTWPWIGCVDHERRSVELHRDVVAGRSIVLNFFYTRCDGSCPGTIERMQLLAEHLQASRRAVRFVSITLDPGHDTPDVLNRYAFDRSLEKLDWRFLHAPTESLDALRRYLGFYDLNEPSDGILRRHAAMVLLGDDRTHRWLTLPAIASLRQWRGSLARCLPRT